MATLEGDSILVTGGTGSFGKAFTRYALQNLKPERLIIYSRDEVKQHEMRNDLGDDSRLRFFIGDVRDVSRLHRALQGVDSVVHCAALKQVDTAEYNPIEYIKSRFIKVKVWELKILNNTICGENDTKPLPSHLSLIGL